MATTAVASATTLRGGGDGAGGDLPDMADLVAGAYGWCFNLGGPSALVAGAVIATLYETMSSCELDLDADDTKWVALGKKSTRLLLLSAFALETISIFVTTVTGTMLMGRPTASLVTQSLATITEATTPLCFLRDNFEFEYLTARISFLQGLLNWLLAIGMTHALPKGESVATRKMNLFIASVLFTMVAIMLSFANTHMMEFYRTYMLFDGPRLNAMALPW
jgi:hypothetical protein